MKAIAIWQRQWPEAEMTEVEVHMATYSLFVCAATVQISIMVVEVTSGKSHA